MFFIPHTIPQILAMVIQVVIILIIADAIIWNIVAFGGKVSSYNPFVKAVRGVVNPLLNPLRKALPAYKTGGWDVTPIIAICLLQAIQFWLAGH